MKLNSYHLLQYVPIRQRLLSNFLENTDMPATLRSFLLGSGAALVTLLTLRSGPANAEPPAEAAVALTDVYAKANQALMRGDASTWSKLVPMTQDFVLMAPFGGKPSRYADYPPERIARMGEFFRNGRFSQQLLQAYSAENLIVLVTIERANVEVGGLPVQDWGLRVTSVFKRDGTVWKLAHRHADPLTEDLSLDQAAKLARGERAPAAK